MARHQRMPPQEAGYTYAVEPTAVNNLLANEEESIYRHLPRNLEWQVLAGCCRSLPFTGTLTAERPNPTYYVEKLSF